MIGGRVRKWIGEHPHSGRRLDVGCGPRSRLSANGIDAIGVDLHLGWGIAACATHLPFVSGAFASVWSFGLLHHLLDAAAQQALSEMVRVTQPGGYVVVFDGVLPEDQRMLARLVRWLDRGARMRRQTEHERLLACVGEWHCERFTYATSGLEGVWAWTQTAPKGILECR